VNQGNFSDWCNHITNSINFYSRRKNNKRYDNDFLWEWYYSSTKSNLIGFVKSKVARKLVLSKKFEWFSKNSKSLFETRTILEDELSVLKFDMYIILKVVGHEKYYFPRAYFEDFVTVKNERDFIADLPNNYSGFILKEFEIKLNHTKLSENNYKLISYRAMIQLTNQWRQYFIKRSSINTIPSNGDVIFDCGSCIGDTALLFAICVGKEGHVHTFDPVPLHNKYIKLQSKINNHLGNIFSINELAVGNTTINVSNKHGLQDPKNIEPGGLHLANYNIIKLDDYFQNKNLKKIDYIKMDIEGAENDALNGSKYILNNYKPKLAISAYHTKNDLWTIPQIIKNSNPNYKIFFDHHLPIEWEACFYAI